MLDNTLGVDSEMSGCWDGYVAGKWEGKGRGWKWVKVRGKTVIESSDEARKNEKRRRKEKDTSAQGWNSHGRESKQQKHPARMGEWNGGKREDPAEVRTG